MNTMQKYSHTQAGITMLEVLVAIVVLSFGLLGMLGLIMNSLKMTSSSHYRTIAAQQLAAMAEAINANPNLIANYAPPGSPPSSSSYANCLGTAGCTTAELPKIDYALWQQNVRVLLPSGTGTVSTSPRPTVRICWNESARITISGGTTGAADTCLDAQL